MCALLKTQISMYAFITLSLFHSHTQKYMHVDIHVKCNVFSNDLETGWPITSTCYGLGMNLHPPAGVAGKPVPGWNGRT